jgi:hypothetical protein
MCSVADLSTYYGMCVCNIDGVLDLVLVAQDSDHSCDSY